MQVDNKEIKNIFKNKCVSVVCQLTFNSIIFTNSTNENSAFIIISARHIIIYQRVPVIAFIYSLKSVLNAIKIIC